MKGTKHAFINIGSGIVFTVLIFLALLHSPLGQMYIGKYLFSLVSKELSIDAYCSKFSFNIFTKRVKIQKLYFSDKYKQEMLQVETLSLSVKNFSTTHLSFNFASLDRPSFNLVIYKQDSISNFRYILDYIESIQGDGEADFDVKIGSLNLKGGSFNFDDQRVLRPSPHVIDVDNVEIKNVNVDAEHLFIQGKDIFAQINQIAFEEKSGFELKSFSSNFYISPDSMVAQKVKAQTNQSRLDLDLKFETSSWNSYSEIYSEVNMKAFVRNISFNMNDLAFFSEQIQGMNSQVRLSGVLKGCIDNFEATKLSLKTGTSTLFFGDVGVKGLPDFYRTEFDMQIKNFQTNAYDVAEFSLPGRRKGGLPEFLQTLNFLGMQGRFVGRIDDFQTDLQLSSNLGDLLLNLEVRDHDEDGFFANGGLQSTSFNFGKMLKKEKWLGNVTFNMEVQGNGLTLKDMDFHFLGTVPIMDFNGAKVEDIAIDGQVHADYFKGHLSIGDKDANLVFDGLLDFEREVPIANFSTTIHYLDLSHYNIIEDSLPFIVKTRIDANYTGANVDDILGSLKVQDFFLHGREAEFTMKEMTIFTGKGKNGVKNVKVSSSLLDANLEGVFYFEKIPTTLTDVFYRCIPSFYRSDPSQINTLTSSLSSSSNTTSSLKPPKDTIYQRFELDLNLKNVNPLLDIFTPGLQLTSNTLLKMNYSSDNGGDLEVDFSSPFVKSYGVFLTNLKFKGRIEENKFLLNGNIDKVALGDSVALTDFYVSSNFYGKDTIQWNMGWDNNKTDVQRISADLKGLIDFSNPTYILCQVLPSQLNFAKDQWLIEDGCKLFIANSYLNFENFGIKSLNSKVSVFLDGEISKSSNSELYAKLSNFELSYFDFFFKKIGMDVKGKSSGIVKINNFFGDMALNSNINISSFFMNGYEMGDAHFFTSFNTALKAIYARFEIDNPESKMLTPILLAEGYYYPTRKENQYDFNIECSSLPLNVLQPYFESFASNLFGTANGKITLKGAGDSPYFAGSLIVDEIGMYINELHVDYTMKKVQVDLSSNVIRFANVPIVDALYKTKGLLNGEITHNNFYDFGLQVRVDFNDFLLLNNKDHNFLYNGQVFGSGFAEITGTFEDIKISVTAKTDKNTKVDFNLASQMEVAETDFIVFRSMNRDSSRINRSSVYQERRLPSIENKVSIYLNISATPEAQIGINIKDAKMSGQLYSKGSGDLRFIYNAQGQTFLYGTYLVNEGTFDFSMQDLLTKTFKLTSGGSISWTGDLMDARVDIKAVYPVKTSLAPILEDYVKQGGDLSRKVSVESEISIQGNLLNPQLGFDINLLNVSDDVNDRFSVLVNKENESEMIKQTFSLLVLNSFIPVGGNDLMPSLSSSVFTSSSEILFSQFNSVLSKLSKDFDIGVNYTPENDLNAPEFQLMMSGQMFDNRLAIDGNFGVGGDPKLGTASPSGSSNITGDINVEYAVTDKLRLKAFNRSNERDLLKPQSSYTFGLGVLYRRDFDTFYEFLFPKKNKLSIKDSLPLVIPKKLD